MGRWVDFSQTYRTMDKPFMEIVWWVFKQLYEKGLVYEGFKVMPFSAKLGTPLSNFEATENYKDVDDPSLTVALQSLDDPKLYFLVWTTTPWTSFPIWPLMVSPVIEYVKVIDILQAAIHFSLLLLKTYYKQLSEIEILMVRNSLVWNWKESAMFLSLTYFPDHGHKGLFG